MIDYKKESDEKLMLAVQHGDDAAFTEIYQRYSQRILYFLFKMLSQDEATAQDILQDVFLKIAESPEKFDPTRSFKTWLFTLAANRCKNYFRDYKNKFTSLTNELDSALENEILPEITEENLKKKRQLNAAIDELHPAYKEAFLLRYSEGLTLDEIALVMNCPQGTVKSRLHSAIKLLSKTLQPELKN